MGLLNNIKDHFTNAEFSVAPNKKVKTICADFKKTFGCTLAIYKGAQLADPELTLAALNKKTTKDVNTTAEVKALTDVCVTSSNARKIVETFPKDAKLIFGPDRNLGNYINSVTGRQMLLWHGACHVHERFSVERLVQLKKQYPTAKVLAHPECKAAVLTLADVIGSTAALLEYAKKSDENEFLVATEAGILFEMQRACPKKTFIPVPPEISETFDENGNLIPCACNECNYMRLNTMQKLYDCLKNETNEIVVDPEIARKAIGCIDRMLELSK